MSNRRDFIKISALGAGGAALAASSVSFLKGPSLFASDGPKGAPKNQNLRRFPTYCEVCFWKCAGWTYVNDDNEIVKIIGNEDDPHCNGRLCPRGTGGIGMYNDEDRLKTPLIRVNEGGKQTFKEASWEEALDLIASKMEEIKSKYGPESFALLKHGSPGSHFEHLFKAYGSDTIGEPAYAQCRGPREVGFSTTFGSWVGSPEPTDIRDTKCLVLIGSHIGENMHNSQVQEMSDAIDKGATIITVDPRLSTAASKSKYWLPIKPATDIALLMAWVHVLIYDDLYDRDYVNQYTIGFEQLKEHVENMTPEWAYGITTIKPNVIRETARAMADASPSVIVHPGRHVTWYGDDTQRARAMAILNALLGSWGKRGGFYFKEKLGLPKYPHPPFPKPKWSWETLGEKYPLAGMGITTEIIKASIPEEAEGHEVKAWLIAGTNLIKTIPNKELVRKALNSIEFLAVVDTMPMDITGYADVVLPECTYLERYDGIRSATNRKPNIALRMPAVEPKYNTKPAWWMAKQLGDRMNLQEYFNYNDFSEVLDWQLQKVGTSLEEMQKIGYKEYERETGSPYLKNGEDYKFNTSSGKIELYSAELAGLGFDPMPVYTPHPEPEYGFYRLIYGRAPMHTFSRTANNPNLTDLKKENDLWVNPKVAKLWDLETGQYVWLKNQDDVVSSFPIKVRVTERIRWDSVYMVHGFGHTNRKLSRAYGKGASDTEMITNVMVDPIMGGTGMRGNFVTFLTEDPGKEVEL
ncbi:MAG: molybdopterin-dependent oxidoreductase [Bacteroidales bacterium]|nr:molybdopterin-dependent oxidoreductase [Bacteroidales bacterium]MCF8402620.1 molybdopterin-dependent oxidoreductase [Bacteroidales bacterium]